MSRRRSWVGLVLVGSLVGGLAGCSGDSAGGGGSGSGSGDGTGGGSGGLARLRVEVLETYSHDPNAFTQGLELHDGRLYEGTGMYGQSEVRIVDPETGQVDQAVPLPPELFGEGLTRVGDRLWQLTFQEQTALLRDAASLAELDRVSYEGEGWGLCYDQPRDRLIMSNGTPELTFRDPASFEPTGSVPVTRDGEPQPQINELECVGDRVWANIWQTDEIVRIDPESGRVDAVVDAAGLLSESEEVAADVLNGIAAAPGFGDAGADEAFLITGKYWPTMFLVRFVPAGG